MNHPESEIIQLLQDPETRDRGFMMLVELYQKPLYGHIRRLVGSHEDAEDVLQETFILVYNHLDTFKGESKLYTWLYRIATNECNRHFRHREFRIRKMNVDSEQALELDAGVALEDSEMILLKFQKAVRTLPKKQQVVFNLRYYDELPYEDMAQVLKTSVGTLRTTYHFAFDKIKNTWQNMIEKELPFKVPADFFERFPEKTLLLAKQRQERLRRTKRMVRTVAVFSAAAAVLLMVVVVPPSKKPLVHGTENVDAVLQDLSNDDLNKMTVVYGSELMDQELAQENTY